VALTRAALLVEACLYQVAGWAEAEDALRTAEALAHTDQQRGAAASERGCLAYAATLFSVRDRADEARAAFGRGAALLGPGAAGRPLLGFRRGLVAENLASNPAAARAAFRKAHAGAVAHGDTLLTSFTWRHLAGLAAAEGDLAEARHGFAESLRIRVALGYLVGTAPALTALAAVTPDPGESGRLRAEAARLHELLGGVPAWLGPEL
jgi:hypothetical protein